MTVRRVAVLSLAAILLTPSCRGDEGGAGLQAASEEATSDGPSADDAEAINDLQDELADAVAGRDIDLLRWCAEARDAEGFDLLVYLDLDATDSQVAAVEDAPQPLGEVVFVDRAATLAELQELFKDSPQILESVNPETLPESFRLDLGSTDPHVAREEIGELDGVREAVGYPAIDELCAGR